MTYNMTSQNIDLSSWDTLYKSLIAYVITLCNKNSCADLHHYITVRITRGFQNMSLGIAVNREQI